MDKRLCGVYLAEDGTVLRTVAAEDGQRTQSTDTFLPFAWAQYAADQPGVETVSLAGEGAYRYRLECADPATWKTLLAEKDPPAEAVRPLENQYLLATQQRLFSGMLFHELRRCAIDIETACATPGGFSNPREKEDRVLAIGLLSSDATVPEYLTLEEHTDAGERALLKRFNERLQALDPDVIEGHNVFSFDFDYLGRRCQRFRLPRAWGRYGQQAIFRKSRLRAAERWIDYLRCDIPGRAVFDTLLAVQIYDVSTRELSAYGLKDVAIYFGITQESDARTYIAGDQIQVMFTEDRERFLAYLGDDLRETRGISDLLLPTYVAQAQTYPMLLQEVCLRGTAQKVDQMLLEKYHAANAALPDYPEVSGFEGGFTRSYLTGVFKKVLHFDVASLYPSLLMSIGRNPTTDTLGVFIPLLKELRAYRLQYKQRAREAESETLRQEYNARQQSFKILINSFYGYLGFSGGRFADSDLAAEVTRRGRELLQALIARFEAIGATVLEADTDGIYLSMAECWEQPESLLEQVRDVLPEGIELEYDGRYESMFSYKAKNYALYDGDKITVRGSALRSRGIEPFLKQMTDNLLRYLLGIDAEEPRELLSSLRNRIESGEMPVTELAKSENLSMSPFAYQKKIEGGGKPRRAALEVALQMDPSPRMGERVSYYILPRQKGQTSDWQRARPLKASDPAIAPYDPKYYLKKLDDWLKRYGEFLAPEPEAQTGLFD